MAADDLVPGRFQGICNIDSTVTINLYMKYINEHIYHITDFGLYYVSTMIMHYEYPTWSGIHSNRQHTQTDPPMYTSQN